MDDDCFLDGVEDTAEIACFERRVISFITDTVEFVDDLVGKQDGLAFALANESAKRIEKVRVIGLLAGCEELCEANLPAKEHNKLVSGMHKSMFDSIYWGG